MFGRYSSSSSPTPPAAKSPSSSSFSFSTPPPLFSSISSSSNTTTNGASLTSLGAVPPRAAPVDPFPSIGSRPSDVLVARCHEIKRISKMLVAYFEGLSVAHQSHSATLLKLSDPKLIQTPLAESTLFIPATSATSSSLNSSTSGGNTPIGGAGGGWADLLQQTKETNTLVAEEHAALAKNLNKNVVIPLKKIRPDIKSHIAALEKEVNKLIEAVIKERESSTTILTSLSTAITSAGLTLSMNASDSSQDPVILKAAAATQIKQQVIKENELLAAVLSWTEKTEAKEKDVWREINRCWSIWETANSNLLLTNQQQSMILSAGVDGVAPETEWNYFQRSNFTIPPETPLRSPDEVTYVGRDDALTEPVKEGLLDRQSRILKSWKPSFYILTPSGNLLSYANSGANFASPVNSMNLTLCSLGPMPIPDVPTKGKALEALFTVQDGEGTKHVFRAKSWEELNAWWVELEKVSLFFCRRFGLIFTKPLSSPSLTTSARESSSIAGTPTEPSATTPFSNAEQDVLEAMEEEHPVEGEHDGNDRHNDDDADSDVSLDHDNGDLGSPSPSTPRKKSLAFGATGVDPTLSPLANGNVMNGVGSTTTPTKPKRKSIPKLMDDEGEDSGDLGTDISAALQAVGLSNGSSSKASGDPSEEGALDIPSSPHQGPPILTESVESPN
ncbi:BQ5605_C022g09427 [Microbotryum silenes-dioicae]|uniref:BQ5605_C022g09427 protein n=1 Tax=Microbotryum silenes-dioicae TaxID=796604 RepID=A0A2X0PK76_9BASI|nr:BQ5605_C022g09427 [Microbotryum silenes-dioicae]